MSKKKRPRWKGDLAKPIYVGDLPFHASGKEASAWLKQAVGREIMEKLRLLMKHYRIADKDDYLGLALALARDFVPGFQVINTKLKLRHGTWGAVVRANAGRPITWPPERLDRLLKVVEETKQQRGLSDRDALRIVMQNGEWRQPIKKGGQPLKEGGEEEQWLKTLDNRLKEARRLAVT